MENITRASIQRSNPMIWAGIPRVKKNEITADSVVKSVCFVSEITDIEIRLKSRKREIVQPRQIAMYLIKKHTNLSLKQIGSFFGGFDHTTVIHSVQTVEDLIDTDMNYKILLNSAERRIFDTPNVITAHDNELNTIIVE